MSSREIPPMGEARVSVAAAAVVSVFTKGTAVVSIINPKPNFPPVERFLTTVINGRSSINITEAGTVIIRATGSSVLYDYGDAARVLDTLSFQLQTDPIEVNVSAELTPASILNGMITSTTAADVTATLPTGTTMENAVLTMRVNETFNWSVINTGGTNTVIIAANTGHTIVGSPNVFASYSGMFRTRKVGTATFVTYRIAI